MEQKPQTHSRAALLVGGALLLATMFAIVSGPAMTPHADGVPPLYSDLRR